MELQGGGDDRHAQTLFEMGEQALDVAEDLGRSDVRVPLHRASLLTERIMRALERGQVEPAWEARLTEALAAARAIEDGPQVDLAELVATLQRIALARRQSQDEAPLVERALTLGRRLTGHPHHGVRARLLLGEALLAEARLRLERGGNPLFSLDEADALHRSLVAEVGWTEADAAESHILRCRVLRTQGVDPTPFLLAHQGAFEQGLKDYAGDYGAPQAFARAWLECAQARLELGRDPGEALERARPLVALTRQQGGDAPGPRYTLAQLRILEAWASPSGRLPNLAEAEAQVRGVLAAQPDRLDAQVLRAYVRWLEGRPDAAREALTRVPADHLLRRLHRHLCRTLGA